MRLFSKTRPSVALWIVFAAMLAVLAGTGIPAFGQAVTGNVTGVVKDATGALIPNATVTLSNSETNFVRKTTANNAGYFSFASVLPGQYVVQVSSPQFRDWRSQPFPLRPGDQIAIPDIKLQVGSEMQQVTVEANTPDMKMLDTGEHSDVITEKELQTLAIVGRDAGELVRILPGFDLSTGANGVSNQAGYNSAVVGLSGPEGSFSANGLGTDSMAVVLDGVSITDIGSNGGTIMNLNVDMIDEVKVSTSSFSAENAKGPAIINAVGKSGTATFHGMGYFYARDTALNANDWYNNFLQQPRPAGRYLYPGGQIGGPVIFPHSDFNHNRNKLFFFLAYEYSNQLYSPETLGSWVPTMAERQGDFGLNSLNSQLCGARPDGKQNPNAILPMCQTENFLPDGTEVTNGNIAGMGNPSGVALLNWLPLPNANPFTNSDGFNYIQEVLQTQNGSQFHAKLTYDISENDTLSAGYYLQRQISEDPVGYGVTAGAVIYPGDVTNGDISNVMFANYTHNFSPKLTNELSLAMSLVSSPGNLNNPYAVDRFTMDRYNCDDQAERTAGTCNPGNGNYNYFGIYKNSGDYSVPAISGNGQNGYPNITMPGGFYANHVRMKKTVPDIADTLTWSKGSHLITTGIYAEKGVLNGLADYGAFPQGEFTFNPGNDYFQYNDETVTGSTSQFTGCENSDPAGNERLSGASYLGECMTPNALIYLGYADTFQQTNFSPTVDMEYTTVSGFVNDTWKLKRLTLDYGLRMEHIGAWTDKHGNGLATFSPSLYSQQCGGDTRNCTSEYMPGVTWHGINSAVSNSVNSPPAVWWSPRFGMSWDIRGNGQTILRGGWGVYRSQEEFDPYAEAAATAQGYKTSSLQGELSFDSIEDQSPVNPPDFNVYTISSTDSSRPIHYEYNATIDQAINWRPLRSLLEISYVGADGRHLDSGYNEASDLNAIPLGQLFNACGTLQGLGCLPVSVTGGDAPGDIGGLTTPEVDYFRTYPFYSGVYQLKHTFYSTYNSGQIQWNKTGGKWYTFGANYTFSKNLATSATWSNEVANPFNLRDDYIPTEYDRTQVFNVHYLVNLGNDYHFGPKAVRELVNGWQITGISTVQSGPPLASIEGENFGFGYGEIQPVQVEYLDQVDPSTITPDCVNTWHIPADQNGNHFCVNSLNPTVWLGTPDVQLMPTLYCNPAGGPHAHQYINPTCFGIPAPGQNGPYRLPYLRGPAYIDHDLSLLKNFKVRNTQSLQLRVEAFNVFNHPLASFNNNDTSTDLTLSQQFGTAGQRLTMSDLTEPGFGIADIKHNPYGGRLLELSAKYTF